MSKTRFAFLAVFALLAILPPASAAGERALASEAPPPAWKQGIQYRMEARLEEDREVLSARGQVRYQNESPDTLTDFYFHLYLNAFRPNSAWARHDLERGIRTFQDLGPEEHGFERVEGMRVDGSPASVSYPYAPDSTILRVELPRALPPGGAITLDFDWEARPSSIPRRQGRRGRHYDFAQWYPRVVAYDLEGWADHPLYRAGEFYGDFATYDITFELQDDQVMGATGVPVEGDPGWVGAAAPGTPAVDYRREFYGPVGGPPCRRGPMGETSCGIPSQEEGPPNAQSLGLLDPEAQGGWKQVRFYARDVHHFAWSTSPEYIYEHGKYKDTSIHVLYQPGDEESWGGGIAVERTATALEWLEWVFGPYLYPQVTNLHRIEGGGTEFPMVVMDGSANLGLIVHEVGHIYAMGMLANNEWREGWLDEGLISFQTSWFQERVMPGADVWTGSEMRVLDLDLRGISEPVVQPAEYFSSQGIYSTMIYTKASLIFRMLRDMVGEEAFRRVLNVYFQRYHFSHVDEEAFQAVAEEVLRMELDWFFGQWLHATGTVEYGIGEVEVEEDARGGFRTRVTLERNGRMTMPVPLRVEGDGEVRDTVVPGWATLHTHVIRTGWRPQSVQVDPDGTILDWNGLNDHWPRRPWRNPSIVRSLDDPFRPAPVSRDQLVCSFFPLAWYNDAGGFTLGFQRRGNYMGSMKRALVRIGMPAFETGDKGGGAERADYGSVYYRIQDPILLGRPRFGAEAEFFAGEGRAFGRLAYEWLLSAGLGSGPRRSLSLFSSVANVYDGTYLRAGRWEPEDHTLGEWGVGLSQTRGMPGGSLSWSLEGAGGVSSLDHRYFRGSLELGMRRSLPRRWSLELRAAAAGAVGRDPETGDWKTGAVPLERKYFLGGGGAFEALRNPFIRSAGAPMEEVGFIPGGGNVRGVDPLRSVGGFLALNLDLVSGEMALGPLGIRARAFTDLAYTPGLETRKVDLDLVAISEHPVVADAGLGVELGWRRSPIRLRVDLPILVSDPVLAVTETEGSLRLRARVSVSGY